MQLFYAPDIMPPLYALGEEESKHCVRVLRLRRGGRIHITDGRGNLFCCEITDAVADAVAAMNQTYVNDLKKTGSFDKAAQAKALNGAISAAIKSLSSDALDYIKRISGGDTVGYLTTRIQAQIDHNKTAKAAQQ